MFDKLMAWARLYFPVSLDKLLLILHFALHSIRCNLLFLMFLVCLSVCYKSVSLAETDEPVEIPFEPKEPCIRWGLDIPKEEAV